MSTTEVDVVVIGAGVVGLACAAELSALGQSVVVIERETRVGQGTSSRNSGVIHAGIYYPKGSLKAELCVEGRERLYARALSRNLPHRELGKLIVASEASEVPALETLLSRGRDNGARELYMVDAKRALELEPAVRAVAALCSPRTGIIDAHALVSSYLRDALEQRAALALASEVVGIELLGAHDLRVTARTASGEVSRVRSSHVINAAGLGAARVAALAGLDVDRLGYRQHLCKGDYFKLGSRRRGLASRLIYPVPAAAGLGVHLTLDMNGGLRAGPDTEYIDAPRYDVSDAKRATFGAALRRIVPAVQDEDLEPDYAGIRPKLQGPGEGFRDFVIESAAPHGAAGLINLLGIESPGLTASGAIAHRVAQLVS